MRLLQKVILLVGIVVLLSSCKKDQPGLVVGKIHKASKLATTEFTIDKIVHGTKEKRWIVKFGDAQFIAYSKAIVKAGVDLEKLSKDDIKIEDKSIELTLPPVEIINFSYPPQHFEKSDLSSNSFGNKITVFDQEQFFRQAEVAIRENLQYMGIVETTQKRTRTMLRVLLESLGYQEIYIKFKNDKLIFDKVKDPGKPDKEDPTNE